MTPKERAAMQQALEAICGAKLCEINSMSSRQEMLRLMDKAITALQEALASRCQTTTTEQAEQAEQSQLADATLEPVAWFVQYKNRHEFVFGNKPEFIIDGVVEPLYAAPLAKQDTHATHVVRTKDPCNPWQDLTDDEIGALLCEHRYYQGDLRLQDFARAVIAADREKNNLCERTK